MMDHRDGQIYGPYSDLFSFLMASVKGALSTEKGSCSSSSSPEEQLEYRDASEDLEKWKRKVEEAEDEKSKLLLEKLESEDQKKQAQKEVLSLMALQKNSEASSMDMKKEQEDAISDLMKRNRALTDQLKKCEAILKSKRAEHAALQQKFKINAEIPEKKMVFVRMEKGEMEDTCSVFSINQTPFFVLKGCEALITFEEDEVATKILKQDKCPVMFGKKMVNVKPRPVKLGPSVKFEIHMKVAKKKIRFSNALPVLPEERMRDRLEVSFSKVSRGGGEVDKVAYDKDTGSGQIFFLNSGDQISVFL
ncbi:hypothetical protein JZ751_029443 [Albula glossodonta]|uniref:NID domain-containing protein n=1 Tax=Albula glossodonta TaxID=121402 RepID=A0A8T2P6I1_9TELE|nr:hypothetical protein JZ751_029443 [Albula glossodonta]